MAVNLSPVGGVAAQFFTNAGVPLSGGKIYTYAAGTSTPQATYTTGAGNIQHSNPIVLDAAGRVPTGEIWLTDGLSYKFVLKDANDVLIATYDNIVGINSNFVNFVNQQEIQTATAGQTVFTLTTMEYQPGIGNLSVFVDGVNQYGPGAQYAYTETSSTVVTFVSGLHVGASVKFTTTEIQNSGIGDASQITYTYPDVNAVQESVEDRLAQYVSVKDFGAVGDGVTDDTDAIQNALDTGRLVFLPQGEYKVTDSLILASGGGLIGEGENSQLIRWFTGGRLLGYPGGTAYGDPIILRDFLITTDDSITVASGDTGIDIGYSTAWAGRGDISNIVITLQWDGLKWQGGTMNPIANVQTIHNFGHGFYAINGRGELYGCLAQYNWGNGYNYYMATQAETGIQFTRCGTFANKGWGYLFDAASGVIGANIFMMGCSSSTDGGGGIGFGSEYRQIWMTQTLIESAGDAYIPYNANEIKPGETPWVEVPLAVGLYMINSCRVVHISDLFVQTCLGNGCLFDLVDGLLISNATVVENGRSESGTAYQNGIYFNSFNSPVLISNLRTTSAGGNTYQLLDINIAQNNNSIDFVNCTFGSYFSVNNTSIRHNGSITALTNSVASASVVTIPQYVNYAVITGTTTIDAITAAWAGKTVTLKFADALIVVNGNNLYLSAQFNTTANDTLTLVCDGTNWYEVSRSANRA